MVLDLVAWVQAPESLVSALVLDLEVLAQAPLCLVSALVQESLIVYGVGKVVGVVEEVLEMPSTDVYVVRGSHGEILIPAVKDYVKTVETGQRRIVVGGIEELVP